jgi:hypothetical protein
LENRLLTGARRFARVAPNFLLCFTEIKRDRLIDEKGKPRRHPKRDPRRSLRAAEVAVFVKQYGRKAQKGVEPNDRRFDEDVQRRVKQMNPLEFDRLIREDEE